jgi:hypothetical protein
MSTRVQNSVSILALSLGMTVAAAAQSKLQQPQQPLQQWILPAGGAIQSTKGSSPVLRPGQVSSRVIALSHVDSAPVSSSKRGVATFPTFKGTISVGRTRYPFTMVGSNPFLKSAKPVVVTVPIIPVVLNFADGTVLDPTVGGGGCAGDTSALDLTLQSPLFQSLDYGEGVGRQFVEEVRRMEFWAYTGPGRLNPNYSVRIAPKVLPTLTLSPTSEIGSTEAAHCGRLGRLEGPSFNAYLRTIILPQLPRFGVGATAFPVFLLLNTVTDFPGVTLAGYHSQLAVGGQTYGVALFAASGSSSPDVSVLSHEIAEWYDDPYGNNPTPAWGHIGQVDGCQNNLEVGDPLNGTLWPPVEMANGFTYHLQETAFFSWFFHQVPSIGLGGWYSSFGTFLTPAEPCF